MLTVARSASAFRTYLFSLLPLPPTGRFLPFLFLLVCLQQLALPAEEWLTLIANVVLPAGAPGCGVAQTSTARVVEDANFWLLLATFFFALCLRCTAALFFFVLSWAFWIFVSMFLFCFVF